MSQYSKIVGASPQNRQKSSRLRQKQVQQHQENIDHSKNKQLQIVTTKIHRVAHVCLLTNLELQHSSSVSANAHQLQARVQLIKKTAPQPLIFFQYHYFCVNSFWQSATVGHRLYTTYK